MRSGISLPLAGVFVFFAGLNAWIMLSGRGSRRVWARIHRALGYAFISLYVIFCYFMLLRIRGQSDELSPRIVLHMALAFTLAPLLIMKLVAVKSHNTAWGLLQGLGITIFSIAFALVATNAFVHFLRDLSPHKVPATISEVIVVGVLAACAIAFFGVHRKPKHNSQPATSAIKTTAQQSHSDGKALILTLAHVEPQTHDAKTLRFVLPRGQQIFARPGQFMTFEWVIDGKPVTRSYSICSSTTQASFIDITPKRIEKGYVSKFLNDRAEIGMTVKARGPYGRFCFDEAEHKRIVLIAGGSGITPMMAILRYIDEMCLPIDATLIYCTRMEKDVFFRNDFAALQNRLRTFRHVAVLSQPESFYAGWNGRLRREILEREIERPLESSFFVCGPPRFMELARNLLTDFGVGASNILQESFGAGVSGEKQASTTGPLQVQLSRSGLAFNISPEETVLDAADRSRVLMRFGCRQGVCGTCATRLLSGDVQTEGGEALTEEMKSQGFILPCVSRPLGDISLEA